MLNMNNDIVWVLQNTSAECCVKQLSDITKICNSAVRETANAPSRSRIGSCQTERIVPDLTGKRRRKSSEEKDNKIEWRSLSVTRPQLFRKFKLLLSIWPLWHLADSPHKAHWKLPIRL